jgi:hypothetical protein
MKHEADKAKLERLLAESPPTEGMYVRRRGENLTIGRQEPFGPGGALVDDDRLRLTALGASTWGLSVRRHTGRWEKTPFTGTLHELNAIIQTLMQHLVAPYA